MNDSKFDKAADVSNANDVVVVFRCENVTSLDDETNVVDNDVTSYELNPSVRIDVREKVSKKFNFSQNRNFNIYYF